VHLLYLSAPGGGLETHVRLLAKALRQAGHQVSLLYLHSAAERHADGRDSSEAPTYHATVGDWHHVLSHLVPGRTGFPLLMRALESAHALTRAVISIHRQEPLDLVEIPEIVLPMQQLPVPYVVRLHSAAWTWRQMLGESLGLPDQAERWLEGATLRRAAGISSPCRFLADFVRAQCGLNSRAINIIPYAVDTERFCPAPRPITYKRVLFVGRVEARKGAQLLLQAIPHILQHHTDAEFFFAGRVNEELRGLVDAAPAQVKFLGVVPHAELVSLYQSASVVVVPSLWDNSPNVIYEGMACGKPVVAARVGGIPELVDDDVTGLLVPPRDVDELVSAINDVLNDESLQESMGKMGREKAAHEYSLEKIVNRTMVFYRSAVCD
jgi:glycosyltransferase involved in cell wall biosynthesis